MPATPALQLLNERLEALAKTPGFESTQAVVRAIVRLLGVDDKDGWRLFHDSEGKLRANGHWFMRAEGYADRLATYEVAKGNGKNLDLKVYWVQKQDKSVIHWVTALTPNFEDAPYLASENVGIDFVIPEKADRVLIVLSKEHALRVIELKDRLTPTVDAIFTQWMQGVDFGNKAQLHTVLWNSFDFEPTNRKFYKEISSYFVELKQQLLTHCPQLFDDHGAALFVNRLIGRLIFCWFLDKKTIINQEAAYFETRGTDSTTHYRTKLETLFFRVLNTPIEERPAGIDGKTPFLNGGLFEAKASDYEGEKCVTFPADYFDRLFATLRHYNFTTDESSRTYQQVAIDPEMLGRIFENLLAEQREETGEQARKAKGAFYTPREIVDYMCRESLREYLHTAIGDVPGRDEQLSKLIDKKPHEFRDQQRNYRRDLQPYKHDLLRALDSLTVLDPACGSGAFPLGMLQLLLETHERLESDFDPYKKKLTIIKNNIFGVDIEPMAVDIARLRAWLSIIVDEDGATGRIEPLPNLDFKFVCANSLIPLDDTKGIFDKLDDEKLLEVRDEYFRAKKLSRKQELREKYLKLLDGTNKMDSMFVSKREKMLKTYRPFVAENITAFFDPRIMFGIEDGFGIVIGNPPYVSAVTMKRDDDTKALHQRLYPQVSGAYDLYTLFLLRGVQLANQRSGIFSWIIPNKFLIADYAKDVKDFLRKIGLYSTIDVSSFGVFQSTGVYPIIISGSRQTDKIYKELKVNSKDDFINRKFSELVQQKNHKTFKDFGIKVFSGTTGFQASEVKVCITENENIGEMPFVVSGGIDPYRWSNKNVRFLKTKYKVAYISKCDSVSESKWNDWLTKKIVIAGMTQQIESVFVEEPLALGVGVYAIKNFGGFDPRCLAAVLNSEFMTEYVREKFRHKHLAGGYLAINKTTIEGFPLVDIPPAVSRELALLYDQMVIEQNVEKQASIQSKINESVRDLFG